MTNEELLQKLKEIEWDDFECKRAQDKLPDDVWSTVSAFSNTSGGWIILQRLRNFVDAPYEARPDGVGAEDESQLVEFASDLVCSTITYWFGEQASGQAGGQAGDQPKERPKEQARVQARVQAGVQAKEQVQRLVNVIREDAYTVSDLLRLLHLTGRRNFVENYLKPAIEEGYVLRAYPDKPKHPNQRYYLSEKGLKLVK